jgi:hypothetical protein
VTRPLHWQAKEKVPVAIGAHSIKSVRTFECDIIIGVQRNLLNNICFDHICLLNSSNTHHIHVNTLWSHSIYLRKVALDVSHEVSANKRQRPSSSSTLYQSSSSIEQWDHSLKVAISNPHCGASGQCPRRSRPQLKSPKEFPDLCQNVGLFCWE